MGPRTKRAPEKEMPAAKAGIDEPGFTAGYFGSSAGESDRVRK